MTAAHSDAFVFFGATGDLAYKQVFPALHGLIRDEGFNLPIIGVAKAGWTLDQLKARAKDSLAHHGCVDPAVCDKILGLLQYVDGDYNDPNTFAQLRAELGQSQRPLHYLAKSLRCCRRASSQIRLRRERPSRRGKALRP